MNPIRARLTNLALALVIFALNVYLCWGLFGIEYLKHIGSMDGVFIGLARYVTEHWRDLSWFPLWHLGMPYANTYPPLMHWGVAAAAMISGMSIAHAFHWVTALSYALGPVALFALALRLTKSRWTAFAAAALYSAISWSAWLIPGIAADVGRLHPRRLQALVFYGEAPHIASMTVLPVALLLWDLALERRRVVYVTLAAAGLAAVVLTSWLGGFALVLMIAAHCLARPVTRRDVMLMAVIAIAAYCLALPWATPSLIAATQFNSKDLGADYSRSYFFLPIWAVFAAAALFGLRHAIRKLDGALRFAILFAFLVSSIVFTWTLVRVSVVPQPIRYHLELEMALSVLIACAAGALIPKQWAAVAIAAMCLVLIFPVRAARRYARGLIQPVDITTTTEWKTAQWLNRNWTGERLMLPGSTSFWLTAFSDIPQLNGGTEQGVIDYMARVAAFGIYYGVPYAGGRNGEFSVLWLKALGAQAVEVSGPESEEHYKPFLDPRQFEGLLDPIYHDRGDTLYRVGRPHASLARLVPENSIVARTPKNAIDVDPLRPYVAALDDPAMRRAEFRWTSMHSAHVSASLDPGQAVSVQIAWHKGWRASAEGKPVEVRKDAIGLMYMNPGPGAHEIEMIYDGGSEMRVARVLSAMAAVLLGGGSIFSFRKEA